MRRPLRRQSHSGTARRGRNALAAISHRKNAARPTGRRCRSRPAAPPGTLSGRKLRARRSSTTRAVICCSTAASHNPEDTRARVPAVRRSSHSSTENRAIAGKRKSTAALCRKRDKVRMPFSILNNSLVPEYFSPQKSGKPTVCFTNNASDSSSTARTTCLRCCWPCSGLAGSWRRRWSHRAVAR